MGRMESGDCLEGGERNLSAPAKRREWTPSQDGDRHLEALAEPQNGTERCTTWPAERDERMAKRRIDVSPFIT